MRASGVVLPIFSLPSDEGIGTLGRFALNFIDFLSNSKQQYWQVFPLGLPTNISPYNSYSFFGGNFYLIDIKKLVDDGLINKASYKKYLKLFKKDEISKIDYKKIFFYKIKMLKQAFDNSLGQFDDEISEFKKQNSYWLKSYCLFICLKNYIFQNKPISEWDPAVKHRNETSLNIYQDQLKYQIDFMIFLQYLFHSQFSFIKKYANIKNIKIIGEFPLYANCDSYEVWRFPELFYVDKNLFPIKKLYIDKNENFSKYNLDQKAIYNIEYISETNYDFFNQIFKYFDCIYDEIIIDNFNHYDKYKYIDITQSKEKEKANSAEKYYEADGFKNEIFRNADLILNKRLTYILNDIDFYTPIFLETYGLPVIKTMTKGFADKEGPTFPVKPHQYQSTDFVYISDCLCEPLECWKKSLTILDRQFCKSYLNNVDHKYFNGDFISRAYQSAAEKIMLPIQDILGLNIKYYKNKHEKNDWTFKVNQDDLTDKLSKKLYELASLYGR